MHYLDGPTPDLVFGLALPPEADPLGRLKEAEAREASPLDRPMTGYGRG
jgi:hypothetical protein